MGREERKKINTPREAVVKLGLVHCLQKAKILDILYVFYMPLSRNLLMKLTNISLTLVLATENVKKKKKKTSLSLPGKYKLLLYFGIHLSKYLPSTDKILALAF